MIKAKKTVKVGDRELTLQYTSNALCAYEDAAQKPLSEILQSMGAMAEGRISFGELRLLVYAGLVEHQPATTIQDAGAFIDDMGGLEKAMELCAPLFRDALPASEPDAEGDTAAGNETPAQ